MLLQQTEKYRDLLFGLLVAGIAFFVYANSLENGFTLDDTSVILNNPVLRGDFSAIVKSIDTTGDAQLLPFYRPLTYLTFYAEGRLHGFNPFFIRLFNVLLHSLNAFLVYRLARSLMDIKHAALLSGLLFAVHPIQAEGVDFNAGGRNTMLACFFVLMAYLLHRRSIITNKVSGSLAAALCFLAGLFSKETALALLPLIVAQEILPLYEKRSGSRSKAVMRLFPYAVAAGFYLFMRWTTLSSLGIQTSFLPGLGSSMLQSLYIIPSLSERLINNVYIVPKYLLTVICPTALSSRYTIPEDLHLLALPLVSAWICIIGICGWIFTRGLSRTSLFGLSWVVLFWLPVSGIVYVPGAPLADRFLYIPAIGLWLVVADQASRNIPDSATAGRYAKIIALIVLVVLASLTVRRNFDWKNDVTLYTRFVEQYPENGYAHAGLGSAYFYESKNDDHYGELAEKELEQALALAPTPAAYPPVYTQLGHLKQNRGDCSGALRYYDTALAVYPYDKEARINRAKTLECLGRRNEALADYRFFLTIPGDCSLPGARFYAEQRIGELSN